MPRLAVANRGGAGLPAVPDLHRRWPHVGIGWQTQPATTLLAGWQPAVEVFVKESIEVLEILVETSPGIDSHLLYSVDAASLNMRAWAKDASTKAWLFPMS